jgi:hypothetical protein
VAGSGAGYCSMTVQGSRFKVHGSRFKVHGSRFIVPAGWGHTFAGLEVSQQPGRRFSGPYLQVEEAGRILLGEVVLGTAVLDVVASFEQ